MAVCKIDDCFQEVYVKSRGLCSRHYVRLMSTGTVDDGVKPRGSLDKRFWSKVNIKSENECWEWTAKSKIDGYGVIGRGGRNGKKVLAHRLSWELHFGEIPGSDDYHGTVVMHRCDNRACVNPRHLILGTQKDNVADMDLKSRRVSNARKGEDHPNSRLTNSDVKFIMDSDMKYAELGKMFGYQWKTMSDIKNGRTWKHLNRS